MSTNTDSTTGAAPRQNKLASGLEHAKEGYKNAQEIIRFVDTKVGVFTGFAVLGIGFVLQILKEFFSLPDSIRIQILSIFPEHQIWLYMILLILAGSLFCGIYSLWHGIAALVARPPRPNSKPTILFPFYSESESDWEDAKQCVSKIKSGLTEEQIAREYEIQILNVGSILCKKVDFSRKAATWFKWQVVTISIAAGLFIFLLLCFGNFHHSP